MSAVDGAWSAVATERVLARLRDRSDRITRSAVTGDDWCRAAGHAEAVKWITRIVHDHRGAAVSLITDRYWRTAEDGDVWSQGKRDAYLDAMTCLVEVARLHGVGVAS